MPDVLIPHMSATLTIGWQAPPRSICDLLQGIPPVAHACSDLSQIETRCGARAVGRIASLAGGDQSVTFEMMRQIQGLVLGTDRPGFRKAGAYTSVRPERYAFFSSLESMFRIKVAADDLDERHPVIKAVRLYLDIIFFHPFEDGNARAALLWFTFYCLRYGFGVPDYRRFFGFGFVPGARSCYWEFCSMAIKEIAKT